MRRAKGKIVAKASDGKRPPGAVRRTAAAAAAGTAKARLWVEPYAVRADASVLGKWYSRMLELEIVDRSVALAAKLFVSFFPFVLGVTSLLPASIARSVRDALVYRFGLSGQAVTVVSGAFASAGQTRAATGVFGVVLLFVYAMSFTTALQRVYLRAWRRPPGGGVRNHGRGMRWLAGVVALIAVNAVLAHVLLGGPGDVARSVLGLATSTALWWWTARAMLRREVRWRPLLPGAVLTGVAVTGYVLASRVWMPRSVESNSAQFGFFGVALALVSWFLGMSVAIIAATTLTPVLLEGDGRLARWLRDGGSADGLVPGAAPALPGPTRRLSLLDALGRSSS
jgi:membrane protein